MSEACIIALISGVVSVTSIIASIIISYFSRNKDLEANYKFNKYIAKETINSWEAQRVIEEVEKDRISSYCKLSRHYIIKRYKKIQRKLYNGQPRN